MQHTVHVHFLWNAVLFLFQQSAFVKGHRRTPSDIEFRELTRRDAQSAMNKELAKLLATAPPGLQEVSIECWGLN